jgi:integrase/recombinase XerC
VEEHSEAVVLEGAEAVTAALDVLDAQVQAFGRPVRGSGGAVGEDLGAPARGQRNGLLGHVAVRRRSGGRLVQEPRRLPESLSAEDVAAFIADLGRHRDRAMAPAMVLGGLRSAEVRSLRLADVDMGLRRVRVVGKGGRQRVVPIDDVFFAECAAYLRAERPQVDPTPTRRAAISHRLVGRERAPGADEHRNYGPGFKSRPRP